MAGGFTNFPNGDAVLFIGVIFVNVQMFGMHRVSSFADKKLKSLLHVAIKYDPELRNYYQRKKEEDKHSMLVLKNIKCKLVGRIFAVIKRGNAVCKNADLFAMKKQKKYLFFFCFLS